MALKGKTEGKKLLMCLLDGGEERGWVHRSRRSPQRRLPALKALCHVLSPPQGPSFPCHISAPQGSTEVQGQWKGSEQGCVKEGDRESLQIASEDETSLKK